MTSLREKTELKRKQETSWYGDWERESNSHNKQLRRDDRRDKERTLREERVMKEKDSFTKEEMVKSIRFCKWLARSYGWWLDPDIRVRNT